MAEFVEHQPCPKCGSKDNLGIYSDGSWWCFGCHYFKRGLTSLRKYEPKEPKPLNFPSDASNYIPHIGLSWIKQYGILDKELVDHHVQWSETRQMLLFPYYGETKQNLLAWQGRNFGASGPKWFGRGNLVDLVHLIGPPGNRIVICEDVVSAIKLGRFVTSCPIFGSNPGLKLLVRLSDRFSELVIWLDMDKHREALKTHSKASQLGFNNIKVISTEKDPKALTEGEIKSILFGR